MSDAPGADRFAPNWLDRRLRRLQAPDRPWTILLRAHLAGPIARAEVERAWRDVVAARPEVHVSPGPDGSWVPTRGEPMIIVGAVEPELDRTRHGPHDTAVTLVVDSDPTSTISLVVDHSLTDGLGVRSMLEDLLRSLHGDPVRARPRVSDAALHGLRTARPAFGAAIAQIPPRRLRTLGESGRVTRLASATVTLAAVDEQRHRHGASVGAAVVDATLAALRDHGWTTSRHTTVAVGVPVDLRRHIGDPTGVGNAVVNLTISDDDAGTMAAIDRRIRDQATRRRVGDTLSWVWRATRPGPPSTTSRRGRDVATAMLSNLGSLGEDPCWDHVDRVDFAPPAHQTTSIGVVGLRDELSVTVRSRLLRADLPDQLVGGITARLSSGIVGGG